MQTHTLAQPPPNDCLLSSADAGSGSGDDGKITRLLPVPHPHPHPPLPHPPPPLCVCTRLLHPSLFVLTMLSSTRHSDPSSAARMCLFRGWRVKHSNIGGPTHRFDIHPLETPNSVPTECVCACVLTCYKPRSCLLTSSP